MRRALAVATLTLASAPALAAGPEISAQCDGRTRRLRHALSERQVALLRAGGLINWMRERG